MYSPGYQDHVDLATHPYFHPNKEFVKLGADFSLNETYSYESYK